MIRVDRELFESLNSENIQIEFTTGARKGALANATIKTSKPADYPSYTGPGKDDMLVTLEATWDDRDNVVEVDSSYGVEFYKKDEKDDPTVWKFKRKTAAEKIVPPDNDVLGQTPHVGDIITTYISSPPNDSRYYRRDVSKVHVVGKITKISEKSGAIYFKAAASYDQKFEDKEYKVLKGQYSIISDDFVDKLLMKKLKS